MEQMLKTDIFSRVKTGIYKTLRHCGDFKLIERIREVKKDILLVTIFAEITSKAATLSPHTVGPDSET